MLWTIVVVLIALWALGFQLGPPRPSRVTDTVALQAAFQI